MANSCQGKNKYQLQNTNKTAIPTVSYGALTGMQVRTVCIFRMFNLPIGRGIYPSWNNTCLTKQLKTLYAVNYSQY